MELGVATHFSQGWSVEIVEPAKELGADIVRDALPWAAVEAIPGVYDFSEWRTDYAKTLAVLGLEVRLLFASGNPIYDDGATPYTPEGRAAFAEFVAMALRQNPLVGTIEIGNEFNAQNFVFGPIADAPYEERAQSYTLLLKAVYEKISEEYPNVQVLGGAAHSIPVGYMLQQLDSGAFDYSHGVALHPYTSSPEHVETHVDILRDAIAPAAPPLHATEFGQRFETYEDGAPYLVKMVTAMSAAGFKSAFWYSLKEQEWYGRMELVGSDGSVRPAGKAFEFVQKELLAHGDAVRFLNDPFTRAYAFGDRALVMWGLPRTFRVEGAVEWRDARGLPIERPTALEPEDPVIALFSSPVSIQSAVSFGPQHVLADTYFAFDPRLDDTGGNGNWTYEATRGDGEVRPLTLMPGGEIQNEAWRPYVGDKWLRPLFVSEAGIRPVDFSNGIKPSQKYSTVERFTSEDTAMATICGAWQVSKNSKDGVRLEIAHNEKLLFDTVLMDRTIVRLERVELSPGDTVSFVLGTNKNSEGDWTSRTVRIVTAGSDEAYCKF